MTRTNCIICKEKLNKHQSKVCSKKCRQTLSRVNTSLDYIINKPRHKASMKNHYNKNKKKILKDIQFKRWNKRKTRDFNTERKNEVRNKIIEHINLLEVNKILTLESRQFLFAKELPNKKIYVYEHLKKEYDCMKKSRPKNVSLFLGDVSEFKDLEIDVDCVYLDFCSTLKTNIETLHRLKGVIKNSKLFVITVCPFNDGSDGSDYQIRILKKICETTEINWKPLLGLGYKDQGRMAMFTLVLQNNEK